MKSPTSISLISLEIRRVSLRPYYLAALICSVTMLAFHYFMAAIPLIDPSETDAALFSSYEFLFSLNQLLSLSAFTILGAVMGARFIIEDYSGARAILIFSYPVSRKKIMGAKLLLIFSYSTAAMLLCGVVTGGLFLLTESLFPLCPDTLTAGTAVWIMLSLLCHALFTGFLTLISVWIGFRRKSVPVTIVSAVIVASVVCQVLSAAFAFHPALFLLTGMAAASAVMAVNNLTHSVENMEI